MIGRAGRFVLAAVLLAAAARTAAAQEDWIGLPRGTVPASAMVEDLEGRSVDLGQWIGRRPLLVEFWATWCAQCERLLPVMEEARKRYGDRVDFVVVAVGVNQSPSSIRSHLERHPMSFPVLWDETGAATRAFEAPATAYVVVLDAEGKVAYTGLGPEQDLASALEKVAGR